MSDKKPFNETGFGKFLKKAGAVVPEVLDVALNFVPGGTAVGTAIKAVRGVLKANEEGNAEVQALLAEMEQQERQWELEMERLYADDRKDARARETALIAAGDKNVTQNILAYVGVVGFFGMLAFILSKGITDMSTEASFIVGNLTGMSAAICKDIYGYYFGSSIGSRIKTRMMDAKSD